MNMNLPPERKMNFPPESNSTLFSFIPRIFVATVKNSARIPRVTAELSRIGIRNFVLNQQTPAAVSDLEGRTLSCTENHLQIYRQALQYPYVAIFEDDVYVTDTSRLEIIRECQTLKDWDFIFLGHFPWKIGKRVTENLRESVSWCTHAYLISNRAMRKMLEYTPREIMESGRISTPTLFDLFFSEGGGIDTFIAYKTHTGVFKSYAFYPMLFYQYSISRWELKARVAEKVCLGGWWINKVLIPMWIMYWLVVYLLRRK